MLETAKKQAKDLFGKKIVSTFAPSFENDMCLVHGVMVVTTGFGSVSQGSNPCGPTTKIPKRKPRDFLLLLKKSKIKTGVLRMVVHATAEHSRISVMPVCLHQMGNQFFAIAVQKIDHGDFNHGVTTRLLLHGSTCRTYQHLSGEGWVVDAHVELEQLVLRFS